MKYKKELNDFEKALSLDPSKAKFLRTILNKAYDQSWHKDGPNIDQIIAFAAPFISTPEEAFYVSSTIFSDIYGRHILKKD